MKKTYISIIAVQKRSESAVKVQELLSEYSDLIDLRYGIHEKNEDRGLIILKIKGARALVNTFNSTLNDLKDVKAQCVEL